MASNEPCPDPSVHKEQHHQADLQEQASKAALLAAGKLDRNESRASEQREDILDENGRLSSKSAATSLKHANPKDLPSFPSVGIDTANSASKAALLAKDYKMGPLWQPEESKPASKAALLAADKGANLNLWQASPSSDGHSAATLAMRNSKPINVDYGVTPDNRSKALQAATMSASKNRERANSKPTAPSLSYPDAQNSTANALNAARASTMKTSDGWESQANQAARIKNAHIDAAMYTSAPPVEIERNEAQHQAALRSSAIAMAKQIMQTQDRSAMSASTDPDDIAGAQAASSRSAATTSPDIKQEAMRYLTLQETAQKLAAERLAKVDKSQEDARYREYYGYSDNKPKRLSSRLSMRSSAASGRQRKRASTDGSADLSDSDDEVQARRIRSQMNQLNSGLSKLDEKKQQDDRAKLLAMAEKNVAGRMHKMDEKVFADTGKIPPALMEEWEEKARVRAQQERELQAQNPGKTHIGGGKFMDQTEIEAIAAARLKPTFDAINDTAEKKRARDEELRLEKLEQERLREQEKDKDRADKEEWKRFKSEEKARKEEEKRIAKEDKRKSKDIKRETAATGAAGVALSEVAEKVKEDDGTPSPAAEEGVQRHRSALGRLKDRFRKSQAGEPKTDQTTRETKTPVVESNTATTTAVAAPVALDADQAAHAVDDEDDTAKVPVENAPVVALDTAKAPVEEPVSALSESDKVPADAEPVSALSTESPAVATHVPEHVNDDDADDEEEVDKWKPVAVPSTAALTASAAATTSPQINVEDADADTDIDDERPSRPPFEQKPSLSGYHNDEIPIAKPDLERHISQIPESDGDSSDEDWNDEKKPLGKSSAKEVAERVVASPVVAEDEAAVKKNEDEPPIPSERTLAQLENQRAEPPTPVTPTVAKTEVSTLPKTESATEPLTDPVTTDPNIQLETDPDQKEHTILRQIVNPHGKKYDEEGYGTTAHAAVVPDGSRSTETTKATEIKESTTSSKLTKKQDPVDTTKEEKERKGLRGFISKLRHKDEKGEKSESKSTKSKLTKDSKATTPIATTSTAKEGSEAVSPNTLPAVDVGPSLGEHMGTDGPIGDSKHVSGLGGNPRPESVSSFKRGEAALNDPDDVSSSGVDEDDISRGRGGRLARRFGGKGEGKTEPRTNAEQEETEDEQFEEARDHFDESLAPPPAFAGQAKSESPVRETRFQEQL